MKLGFEPEQRGSRAFVLNYHAVLLSIFKNDLNICATLSVTSSQQSIIPFLFAASYAQVTTNILDFVL